MVDTTALEWFFAPSPRPAPALRPRPPAVVSTVASVTATMPVDILELILKQAWLSYANAPRLAAVDHSFKMANDRAAFELEGSDVVPPRADVTCPPRSSIDPRSGAAVVTFREESSTWGLALRNFVEFQVRAPRADDVGFAIPFGRDDMANLLDLVRNVLQYVRSVP